MGRLCYIFALISIRVCHSDQAIRLDYLSVVTKSWTQSNGPSFGQDCLELLKSVFLSRLSDSLDKNIAIYECESLISC